MGWIRAYSQMKKLRQSLYPGRLNIADLDKAREKGGLSLDNAVQIM